MSKKETEFERYERMQKLQKEAEVQRKKTLELETAAKKKMKKSKMGGSASRNRNWTKDYELGILDEDEEYSYN